MRMKRQQGYFMCMVKTVLLAGMLLPDLAVADKPGVRGAEQVAEPPAAVANATCHGEDGGGNEAAGFPRLAGLDAAYIEGQ